MRTLLLAWVLSGCTEGETYILEGTVVERLGPDRVMVAHREVPGFMPAMTMPFEVRDAAQLDGVGPGDIIVARLRVTDDGSWLARVRVTGTGPVPTSAEPVLPPMLPGQVLPTLEVPVHHGPPWVIGDGQPLPTVVGFIYTRCPIPEFCPAVVTRMQALQAAVEPGSARILLVTLDPEHDTLEVLSAFADSAGADPDVWAFGRLEKDALAPLAARAGLTFAWEGDQIAHSLRLLVLDADGRLVQRHDDGQWSLDEVVSQLE